MKRVLIAVSDLLFQSRIQGAAAALGLDTVATDTMPGFEAALSRQPSAAVVDIHERAFSARDAIARASAAGVPVLAFGRHTAPAELRDARDAGATVVVPRSQLVESLPALIERVLAAGDVAAPDSASL